MPAQNKAKTSVNSRADSGASSRADAGTAENSVTGRPRRLGRGLSTLLAQPVAVGQARSGAAAPAAAHAGEGSPLRDHHADPAATPTPAVGPASHASAAGGDGRDGTLVSVPLDSVAPGRAQPRRRFDEEALGRLARSISTAGVMQPIVVRPMPADAGAPAGVRWELIAGERRWRAARLAGLSSVPAVVSDIDDRAAAEWSLVENLQREDLNPIERAEAFRRLGRDFGMTQAEIADRVGLDRSSVANLVRLCDLEEPIRDDIAAGRLTPGHGKALLALEPGAGRIRVALKARDGVWSVRRLEEYVQATLSTADAPAATPGVKASSARESARRDLERRLRERLGTKVAVRLDAAGLRGRIQVDFYDLDQLDGVLRKMGVQAGGID